MNLFMGIGRITKKPETRYTTKELAITKFTLAITRDIKNKEGQNESDFLNCIAYGKTAELISKYLDKGSQLAIEGKIQTGSYEKDGKKIYTTDIVVEKIQFLDTKKPETNSYEEMGKQVQTELPW